jgi:hypothetical protein
MGCRAARARRHWQPGPALTTRNAARQWAPPPARERRGRAARSAGVTREGPGRPVDNGLGADPQPAGPRPARRASGPLPPARASPAGVGGCLGCPPRRPLPVRSWGSPRTEFGGGPPAGLRGIRCSARPRLAGGAWWLFRLPTPAALPSRSERRPGFACSRPRAWWLPVGAGGGVGAPPVSPCPLPGGLARHFAGLPGSRVPGRTGCCAHPRGVLWAGRGTVAFTSSPPAGRPRSCACDP